MKLIRQFRKYLRSRQGRASLGVVLACALGLAFFVGRTFVDPLPREYKLDFGSAKWIQLPNRLPAAYFRKSLYISGAVERAWIQLAATGRYELYVNNVLVDRRSFPCVRLSGVYDLKRLLSQGRNVIAIYVGAGDFPGQNQILVRGFYGLASSPLQEFRSDSTWKVSATPDGVIGGYPWSSPLLDDTLWADARETQSGERFSTVQTVTFDPRLLANRPDAKWITARVGNQEQVSFLYTLKIPLVHRETWLQVASNGGYDLIVNGRVAAVQPVAPQAVLTGPGASIFPPAQTAVSAPQSPEVLTPNSGLPGAETPAVLKPRSRPSHLQPTVMPRDVLVAPQKPQPGATVSMPDLLNITPPLEPQVPQLSPFPLSLGVSGGIPVLVAYNLSKYVTSGTNSIFIRVHAQNGPALLLAEGYVATAGGSPRWFRTDETWRALAYSKSDAKVNSEQNAAALGDYDNSAWGPLPQVPANPQSPPGQDTTVLLRWSAMIAVIVAFVILFWLAPPLRLTKTNCTLEEIWTHGASIHLLILVTILLLWLLSFDVRFAEDWCFTPTLAVLILALVPLSRLILRPARFTHSNHAEGWRALFSAETRSSRYLTFAGLGIIVLAGLLIRAHGLLEASIDHDEANIIRYSYAVLKSGFPYVVSGSYTKLMSTYELLPYPVALSSLVLGPTELAYRLPSLIFGTLDIALVGWVGYRMVDWRVGLVSALIYACMPTPIGWARNLFYPSQEVFFALLTLWLFFEAIRGPQLNGRFVTLAAVTLVPAYFTWEGMAFLLPTMCVAMLAVKWGQFEWMTNGHLWRCFLVVSAIIVLQLCYRSLVKVPDFLGVAHDLSEVTTPSTVFLQRLVFAPLFYFKALLFPENHVILSLLTICGMFFVWKNSAVKYLCVSLAGIIFFYTCWLPRYSERYCFNGIALLVLASTSIFFLLWDRIRERLAGTSLYGRLSPVDAAMGLFLVLFIISANPFVLKTYRLAADPPNPSHFARLGQQAEPDYRYTDLYALAHAQPGDIIVARMPHVFDFYAAAARTNYSINTALTARMYYDGGVSVPFYGDKHLGLPSICDREQLQDVLSRHGRVWLIGPTYGIKAFSSPDVLNYLQANGQVMAEANAQQVILLRGVRENKSNKAIAVR